MLTCHFHNVCMPVNCELWTLTAELEKRMLAFEMRCYQKLLNISNRDHVTNEEIHRKIQAAFGEYDELLTLVKKWKLRCFGHVSRSSGFAKTVLQGTVSHLGIFVTTGCSSRRQFVTAVRLDIFRPMRHK